MVGLSAAFLVFLLLMIAAVQILFNLYATSMVTSAAREAATTVAGYNASADRCGATAAADGLFVETLGQYGRAGYAQLEWTCTDPDAVSVRIVANHPTILPPRMAGLLSLGHLDRTIVVRVEGWR